MARPYPNPNPNKWQGAAFPCRRDVVALDVEEIYEEIEMEEETEEVKGQARDAFRRGQEMASLAPVNPWDRDNKIQERDSHNAAVIEVRRAGGRPAGRRA